MCRALKILCAAPDAESLRALKSATVSASWELVGGASTADRISISNSSTFRTTHSTVFGIVQLALRTWVLPRLSGLGAPPAPVPPASG